MLKGMRTTLTLDDDVAAALRALGEKRQSSFKAVVNDALRAGLTVLLNAPPEARRAYRTVPVSVGPSRLPSLDDIAEVLAIAEGEDHR